MSAPLLFRCKPAGSNGCDANLVLKLVFLACLAIPDQWRFFPINGRFFPNNGRFFPNNGRHFPDNGFSIFCRLQNQVNTAIIYDLLWISMVRSSQKQGCCHMITANLSNMQFSESCGVYHDLFVSSLPPCFELARTWRPFKGLMRLGVTWDGSKSPHLRNSFKFTFETRGQQSRWIVFKVLVRNQSIDQVQTLNKRCSNAHQSHHHRPRETGAEMCPLQSGLSEKPWSQPGPHVPTSTALPGQVSISANFRGWPVKTQEGFRYIQAPVLYHINACLCIM